MERNGSNVKKIINKFINQNRTSVLDTDVNIRLAVSLYAVKEEDNNKQKDIVLSLLEEYLIDLHKILDGDEINQLLNNYKEVIDYCFDFFSWDVKSGFGLSCSQPKSLTAFCSALINLEDSVYNPFAGIGSYAVEDKEGEYHGEYHGGFYNEENNPKVWALMIINMAAHDCISIDDRTLLGDAFETLANPESLLSELRDNGWGNRFDSVILTPPFGLKDKDRNEFTAVEKSFDLLFDNGELLAVLPATFYVGDTAKHLRKYLIDNGYLTAVIMLPQLFIPLTSVYPCVIVAKKCSHEGVLFVDGRSFVAKNRNGYSFSYKALLGTIEDKDERYCKAVFMDEIASNDYSLNIQRYFPPLQSNELLKEDEVLLQLKDVVEIVKSQSANPIGKENPVVTLKDLSSNYLNCDVDLDKLQQREMPIKLVTEDCLLFSFFGGKPRIGKMHGASQDAPIAISHDIIPFKLLHSEYDKMSEDYLLKSLTADFLLRQAKDYSISSVLTRINASDFLSLRIIVPSLEKQLQICREDTRKSLTEADSKINESFEEFRRDMHVKKHAIGQTLFNLSNWWKVLERARRECNGVVDDKAVIGNIKKVRVSEIYDNLQKGIAKLQTQLNKMDTGYGMQIEDINLSLFVRKYIKENESPIFRYSFLEMGTLVDTDTPDNEGVSLIVNFPLEALSNILNNIVSNAITHGFSNEYDFHNEVQINIAQEGTDYVLEVSNNGKPLEADVTSDIVFAYGLTSGDTSEHFGIGGYEIKKLMREFGGDVELVSNPQDKYPVIYRLIFHHTNINK